MNFINQISISAATIFLFTCNNMMAQDKSVFGANEGAVEFKIFPNPQPEESEAYVSLTGFKAENLLVVVYDMLGREMYSKVELMENEGFLFTISSDGNHLPSSIYLITASANDKVFRQKLIVK